MGRAAGREGPARTAGGVARGRGPARRGGGAAEARTAEAHAVRGGGRGGGGAASSRGPARRERRRRSGESARRRVEAKRGARAGLGAAPRRRTAYDALVAASQARRAAGTAPDGYATLEDRLARTASRRRSARSHGRGARPRRPGRGGRPAGRPPGGPHPPGARAAVHHEPGKGRGEAMGVEARPRRPPRRRSSASTVHSSRCAASRASACSTWCRSGRPGCPER